MLGITLKLKPAGQWQILNPNLNGLRKEVAPTGNLEDLGKEIGV
jgi:hypothetical protein